MSDLTGIQKHKLEKALRMSQGYVLDFSNPSLKSFILDSVGFDILDEKYNNGSGSKANRLRSFWEQEANHTVSKLITDLLLYRMHHDTENDVEIDLIEKDNIHDCLKTAAELSNNTVIEDLDAIQAINTEKDFSLLSKIIRRSIEDNQPEIALDRLHTYLVKYIRELCNKHKIRFETHEALHGIFGKYVKHIVSKGCIKSVMSERILKFLLMS